MKTLDKQFMDSLTITQMDPMEKRLWIEYLPWITDEQKKEYIANHNRKVKSIMKGRELLF